MLALLAVCSITIAVAHGSVFAKHAQIIGRDTVLNSSYDYFVAGGGTSGLTVADRLTENPNSASLFLSVLFQGGSSKRSYVIVQKHRCL